MATTRRRNRSKPRARRPLRSDIGWSTADRIGVLGYDLVHDLIGKVNLGDMAYLEITGRLPDARESKMINALLVTLVEHGITPSSLATRLTHAGAPEALQAAVAAGLLGLGSVFVGSIETAAKMLRQAMPRRDPGAAFAATARRIVDEHRAAKRILPGLGHPIHKPVDPRAPRLFALAQANGFSGPYVKLMRAVQRRAETVYARPLPINATGAIAAVLCEMDLPAEIARGLGVMARAVGLVGHVLEESRRPMALEIWHRVEDEASAATRGRLVRRRSRTRR